jgi:predicted MFS family arabinose efflux permease
LLLFAAGGAIAALANSIGGLMLGRTLQGVGAMGSVLLAVVADLAREQSSNCCDGNGWNGGRPFVCGAP